MKVVKSLAAVLAIALIVGAPGAAVAAAQQELVLGSIVGGKVTDVEPSTFVFEAVGAGVLTVVLRGDGRVDLKLDVTDALGQPVPNGSSDQDLNGDNGNERLAVILFRPGHYHVEVSTWSGLGDFEIAAGWVAFPAFEVPADPDGDPSGATALVPGTPIDSTLDGSTGDMWDWYKVTTDEGGVITVITESAEGDLVLELYAEGQYGEALTRSDQDMQGNTGSESATIQAAPGTTYYFKVSPAFEQGVLITYRVRAGIM